MNDVESTAVPVDVAVLIPHHHRRDLLLPLLQLLNGVYVLVVDDGLESGEWSGVQAIRTSGEVGFASAVNQGLIELEQRGFKWVLVLNDDAQITPEDLVKLCAERLPGRGVISPVVVENGANFGGVQVSRWGRIRALRAPPETVTVDAVWGCCVLIPSWARFSQDYPHGFEDIELCRRMADDGLSTVVVPAARCIHVGGGTLDEHNLSRRESSTYGHLLFYNSWFVAPAIVSLSVLQLLKEKRALPHYKAVLKGFRSWAVQQLPEQWVGD